MAEGGTYSAGTIFLQVVPVFRDVQDKIRRQAKDVGNTLGDEMERSGKDAGERGGKAFGDGFEKESTKSTRKATGELEKVIRKTVSDINDGLKPINLKFENNEARARVKALREDFAGLQKQLDEGVNPKGLQRMADKLQIIHAQVGDLDESLSDVSKHDFARVQKSLGALGQKLEAVQRQAEIEIRIETQEAERAMGAFERKIKTSARKAAQALGDSMDPRIAKLRNDLENLATVDIDAKRAEATLRELTLRARELSKESPNIDVRVDAGVASAELLGIYAAVRKLDGKNVDINVDVNDRGVVARLAALKASLLGTGQGGEETSNAFRSFNAIILAAVTLLPALIPILAAVGAGLLALGPLAIGAGAGIGAMVIGFSGIATAVQAFSQKNKKSAADTQAAAASIRSALFSVRDAQQAVGDAERQAARSAVDSARQVAQARRSAAESIRSALEAQRQAQESYAQSVQGVKDAEQALADARTAEKQKQQSTKNQIADNKLAIRSAVLNAFDATTTLNAVNADGSSTKYDRAQAKLAYDQAQQQLKELRQQEKQLARDKKKQDKEGVNGADAVQSAQEALTNAIRQQRDAQIAVGDAARKVNQARIAGAQAVQQAELQQSRSAADGQRNIARAQEQLRRAQINYNEALKKSNDIGSAADQNLKDALQHLGPAGRKFARFIVTLQQGFYDLRGKIQAAMLPPVQHAIETILHKYGPQFQNFFVRMGRAAGGFFTDLSKAFDSKPFQHFGRVFSKLGPVFFRLFGRVTIEWLKVFASLMTAAAPFSEQFARGLLGMSKALSHFMESKKGQEGVARFMLYAQKVGPDVLAFLGQFIKFVVHLSVALAPWGGVVLKALDGLLRFLNGMSTANLGALATVLIGLFLAFQVGVGVTAALLGGMALLASEVGVIVAAVALAIVIFAALYIRFKFVRTITDLLIKGVKLYIKYQIFLYTTVFKVVFAVAKFIAHLLHLKDIANAVFGFVKRYVPPIFDAVVSAVQATGAAIVDFWQNYAQPALAAFGRFMQRLYNHTLGPVINFILGAFRLLGRIIKRVWDGFIFPILDLWIHVMRKLWDKVLRPIFGMIADHWTHMGDGIRTAWKNVIHPTLSFFGDVARFLWKHWLKPTLDDIASGWSALATGFKWVYDHTLKPVIDAFVKLMGGPDGLRSKFQVAVDAIKLIWAGLKEVITAPIRFVMGTVVNKGLIGGFNKIANFVGSKPMDEFHNKALGFARGGVLPGYTPGRDVHRFRSPTGGALDLSGGEAIMRPEFVRALGAGTINALNAAAISGGVGGVQKALGFAKGGILSNPDARVSMDGKNIAAIAAAQILLAERLAKRDYSIMQGSMAWGGQAAAASGSSHNYPGVADISRAGGGVTFADQSWMRKVGFASWARNIPGASYVGSGEHLHSVSLLSPGDRASSQYRDYLNGYNGLDGGRDYGPRPPMLQGLASMLGNFDLSNIDAGGKGKHGFGLPGWLLDIAKNPVGYISGLVTNPVKAMYDKLGQSDMIHEIAAVPYHLVKAVAEKAIGMIPGGAGIMKAAGFAFDKVSDVGHAIGNATSNVLSGLGSVGGDALGHLGFASGGILPYNGTMKYDAGGYLPPGLTSVVNLTGKPEPVFTHDQFEGGMGGRGGLTYAPTINGSDLTAEDLMDDLEFTYRKMSHGSTGGRYAGARG